MAGYLNVDLILAALIGAKQDPVEHLLSAAERGEQELMILEVALYYAVCCLQGDDRLSFPRFCRLLRCARVVPSPRPFEPPTLEEVANWRQAALEGS
jgi:hypothetical protein